MASILVMVFDGGSLRKQQRRGQLFSFDGIFFLLSVFAIVVGFIYSWSSLSASIMHSLDDFRAYRMANSAANAVIFDPDHGAAVRSGLGVAEDHLISVARIPETSIRAKQDFSIQIGDSYVLQGGSQSYRKNAWCVPRVAADSTTHELILLESCYYWDD